MSNDEDTTIALIGLTEKMTENNNTVSGSMRLMSENTESISEISIRMEEKLDNEVIPVLNEIKASGVLELFKFIKKVFWGEL
jgi:hypothetical protein